MSINYVYKVKKGIHKVIYDKLYFNCSTFRKMHYEEVPEAYDYNGHAYHQHHLSGSQSDGSGGGTGGGGGGGCATPCSDAVMIKIDVPVPLRDEQRFPKEIGKTFVALLLVGFNLFLATVSLAVVHDKVPDRATYGPLPDFVLDNIPAVDWALDVSEILIMIVVNSCVLLITFHKHRFIVMRRVFLLMSLLYFMRSITMYVTVMPMSNTTYYCSPKAPNATAVIILKRAFQLFSGFGLSINGKHTYCGDYIYSGHTVTLVMGYLIIAEYSPKKFWIVHWLAWCASLTGVTMVLLAHGHYTIDVLIAYYVTTRLFWTYHTLANNSLLLKQNGHNYIGREWWFFIFRYFEKNVRGPLPMQYDCPFPIPWTKKVPKLPCRES
ncbi:phosphatidylcholine:ceramide cholinephosphotransferase 1 isoform X1 [Culex quinquefasciatus]|uniref:phosphatidylcholine:ceramide cholinephosphotransferase 1 isoform X1 n=1 Tax=Culex quinquefasciatus TaxID=7176 RepID=UPI0018E29DCC|nr:phosphatidylcholine:ceramide cholinephosphotransferase 1 isoform X1 [Culex quinquefasciatus]